MLEYRRCAHDVEIRVLVTSERCSWQVLRGRAGSHCECSVLAKLDELARNRLRDVDGNDDTFDSEADLGAQLTDRLMVVQVQHRQSIELIVDRRRIRDDLLEGVRRHAKSSRYVETFDARQLAEVRALAANERDLRLVDLVETQHVAGHPLPLSTESLVGQRV